MKMRFVKSHLRMQKKEDFMHFCDFLREQITKPFSSHTSLRQCFCNDGTKAVRNLNNLFKYKLKKIAANLCIFLIIQCMLAQVLF